MKLRSTDQSDEMSKGPTENTIKKLFALSQNRCAYPECGTPVVQRPSGTVTGRICHIKARSRGGPRFDPIQSDGDRHGFANLIILCSVHHDVVDAEPARFTVELLQDMKEMHEREGDIELNQEGARLARKLMDSYYRIEASGEAQVMVGSPGGVQARNLTIKTNRKNPPVPLPQDAIGANVEMRAYVVYLVKRYTEWRLKGIESGKDKRSFHPSMTYQLIEREFGARPNLVRQTEFDRLVAFLQTAIDDTILGRIQRSSGSRNFRSFEEHLQKMRGERGKPRGGAGI